MPTILSPQVVLKYMIIVESIIIAILVAGLTPVLHSVYKRISRRFVAKKTRAAVVETDDAVKIFESMLAKLQCEVRRPSPDKSNDSTFTFTYQSGFFVASFPEVDEPFVGTVGISFFNCFSCKLQYTSVAERVCNEINSMTLPIKCTIYAHDVDTKEPVAMSLHASGIRLIDDEDGLKLLKSLLSAFFHVQRVIAERFDTVSKQDPGDIILNHRPYVSMAYVQAHAELNAQPEGLNQPWYKIPDWTINRLVEVLTGEPLTGKFTALVNGYAIDHVDNFIVFDALFNNDGELQSDRASIILLSDNADVNTRAVANIFLSVTDIDDRMYKIRVDFAQSSLPVTPYRPMESIEAKPVTLSTLICYYRGGEELFKAEAEYMAGEEKLIERCTNGDAAYSLYWGRVLVSDGIYAEAEHYLRNAFSIMRDVMTEPDKVSQDTMSTFCELCFFLSLTYYQLGRSREAYYYIDFIVQHNNVRWTEQFILTMMAMDDPRVTSVLKSLSNMVDNAEPDEANDELREFIKRQYILLDIRAGRTDVARQALEKMLVKNPDSEFVMYWLSKII